MIEQSMAIWIAIGLRKKVLALLQPERIGSLNVAGSALECFERWRNEAEMVLHGKSPLTLTKATQVPQ